jgi:damage-control phosphatase, subfamily I
VNTCLDCIPCLLRQSLEAARNASQDVRVHEQLLRHTLRMIAELDLARSPPHAAQAIHQRLRELTGAKDPYQEAKRRFNRLAMESLPALTAIVRAADDPLLAAARCAVAANAIDLSVASVITDEEVRVALCGIPDGPVHGDWNQFREAAARAKDILYLADNAGEIAVDRLAIQELGPHRVTVAVRGAPVLNDATTADAHEVGMHDLVEVIDNGSDAPGTVLEDCSALFRDRFERAQLVIAKGQGNFETLRGAQKSIAFWFKVKCPLVSHHVGLPLGAHALLPPDDGGGARSTALHRARP